MRTYLVLFYLLFAGVLSLYGNEVLKDENITVWGHEMQYYVDESNQLNFEDIFNDSIVFKSFSEKNKWSFTKKSNTNYWIKIDIPSNRVAEKSYLIEAIDSHINYIEAWLLSHSDTMHFGESGYLMKFKNKHIRHKNFVYDIPPRFATDTTSFFLFKIKSKQNIPLIFKFRSLRYKMVYSNTEYAMLFFIYGVIFLLALYNILTYVFLKERKYLFLFLYICASAIMATNEDSIWFQFLWPNNPIVNQIIFEWSIPLYLVFLNNYLIDFLGFKPEGKLKKFRLFTVAYFLLIKQFSLYFFVPEKIMGGLYLSYSFIVLYFAIRKSISSNRVIRLITLGFIISLIGLVPKLGFFREDVVWLIYYFNFGILIQCIIFTVAMIDDYRITKSEKEKVQLQIIAELEKRKKVIEEKVTERTAHIEAQKKIINQKNEALADAYKKLSEKAEMIDRINIQLTDSNLELENDLEIVKEAHLINRPLDFEDFKSRFPDNEACLLYLSERRWKSGYACKKCGTVKFSVLPNNGSRRCSKCGYVESVTSGTIFHRLHFSLEKAFYLVFYVGMKDTDQNNVELANRLEIPANTCWRFSQKIKKRKSELHIEHKTALDKIIFGELN